MHNNDPHTADRRRARLTPIDDRPVPIVGRLDEHSRFDRIVVFSTPRSGTTTYRSLLSELFGLRPVRAACEDVATSAHAAGNPYEDDGTVEAICRGEIVCTHSPPTARTLKALRATPEILVVNTIRDVRDASISAARFIQHRPTHLCHARFAGLTPDDALALTMAGCRIPFELQPPLTQRANPTGRPLDFPGYAKIATWAVRWAETEYAPALAYERLFTSELATGVEHLAAYLAGFGVVIPPHACAEVLDRMSFESLTGGRTRGTARPGQQLDRGLSGAWFAHPPTLSVRVLAHTLFGDWLDRFGYRRDPVGAGEQPAD